MKKAYKTALQPYELKLIYRLQKFDNNDGTWFSKRLVLSFQAWDQIWWAKKLIV